MVVGNVTGRRDVALTETVLLVLVVVRRIALLRVQIVGVPASSSTSVKRRRILEQMPHPLLLLLLRRLLELG